ncbi:hypothetical protein IFM89_034828 [Coptis chinensis]|uniref:Uncharacterized protein n=1 Tax=Coptis chinensis TaxID=261450 RepID=A0A835H756_9MAGN|nr:hypothetical protein IFM89_034828 [Coptis chinensis]
MDKYTSTKVGEGWRRDITRKCTRLGTRRPVNWWPRRRRGGNGRRRCAPNLFFVRLPSFGCSRESLSGPIALRKNADNKNGKPLLYLVFESTSTRISRNSSILTQRGPSLPFGPTLIRELPLPIVQRGGPLPRSASASTRDLKPQNLLVDKDKGHTQDCRSWPWKSLHRSSQELHTRDCNSAVYEL